MREVVSKTIAFFLKTTVFQKKPLFSKKNHCFPKKPIVFQHVHFFYPIVLKRKIITGMICLSLHHAFWTQYFYQGRSCFNIKNIKRRVH